MSCNKRKNVGNLMFVYRFHVLHRLISLGNKMVVCIFSKSIALIDLLTFDTFPCRKLNPSSRGLKVILESANG